MFQTFCILGACRQAGWCLRWAARPLVLKARTWYRDRGITHLKVFLEPPRDETNKGNNAEKEKKRTKDGQRRLTFRQEEEGERKDSLDGVHNLKLMMPLKAKL